MATAEQYPHLADAAVVERWAEERIEARSDFPALLRRLIVHTNDQVLAVDMRAGGGTDLGGYDGLVEAVKGTPFVPAGPSVWELGVGESPQAKANEDYEKRTNDSLGVEKARTTFVFATARRWPGKRTWAEEKRAEGHWSDVRALDADDIETAFESAPAAHFWFSELVGLPAQGVRMIETWWEAFSTLSQPNLTPELVLAGRADQAAELLRILEAETRLTTISAASTDDILAFVASTLLTTTEQARTDLLARTLIVHDTAALRRLDVTSNLLILLPFDDDLRREAQLVRSHHVILLAPASTPSDIALPPIDRDVFTAGLEAAGVEKGMAERLTRAAHRGLLAFQAESPARGAAIREWSGAFESMIVRRAWLAGAWQEARSGDTDALAVLFGMPYERARSELAPFASGGDPIFTTVGGAWGLVSDEEAWRYANPHLNSQDLLAFETLVRTVLGAADPALELPIDERWLAGLQGKARIHSSDLRRGIATTLAACGSFGEARVIGTSTVADWAIGVVAQILCAANEDNSATLWASLADVLPLLAEAAPDHFLRAVQEASVARSEPLLANLFLDRGQASMSSPHTEMLWALEGLAWSSDHAPLAIKALARLAEIDPGGRLSNRPLASLKDIFRPWFPQTSLPVDRRVAVLDMLRRDHPAIAWNLMLELLPEHHGVGGYTHAPRFRAWKPEERPITYGERWEFESAVGERLLEDAQQDERRWLEVAERIPRFLQKERSAALERLAMVAESAALGPALQEELWTKLDEIVRQHRSYAHTEWALPAEDVDQIAAVAERFRPTDPRGAHKWLFDEHLPNMGDQRVEYNYHAHDELVRAARKAAVAEVLTAAGVEGLLQLAADVEFPSFVGIAAAASPNQELDELGRRLLDDEDPKRANLAAGYISERARQEDFAWIVSQVAELDGYPRRQARLLLLSDDFPEVWALASDLGRDVEAAYWDEFSVLGRGDFKLVNEAATSLFKVGRPLAALDLMSLYARQEDRRVDPELVVNGLTRLVELPDGHPEPMHVSSYELQTLLDYLYESDVDEDQLGVLEWQVLPALGFDARSPVLERRLARDPSFFVDILSLVYRPRDDEGELDSGRASEDAARNAYRLLDEWKVVPGSKDRIGEVDGNELNVWLEKARNLAAAANRREVADVHIGKVFAHSREDEDGTWPTKPVRNAIEQLASPEIEEGFQVQIYNNRGATIRGMTEGGAQERELVARYADLGGRIRDGWPRTAAILNLLAKSYEREATRYDEEAERRREGMDR